MNSKTENSLREKVTFDSDQIKQLAAKWLYGEKWQLADFPTFLELVGILTPVYLSDLNKSADSFKCVDKFNNEFTISLKLGSDIGGLSEIWVANKTILKKYEIPFNMKVITHHFEKPTVSLKSKTISVGNSKTLTILYSKLFCTRILKVDNTTLTIILSEPNGGTANRGTSAVLKNAALIDGYLLGLATIDLDTIYKKITALLGFSDDVISSCEKILFSYSKTVGKNEVILAKILKKRGKLLEYAISNDGETFHVFENGSWKYISCTTRISYNSKEGVYSLSLTTRSETKLDDFTLVKLFPRIKKRVHKLADLF